MILNIDLGTLYIKCVALDNSKIVKSEIIRLEKNSLSIIEVLIKEVIDVYSSMYPIKKINLIPNIGYTEFQFINSESIMESKYEAYMKYQIKNEIKERKRELRMGDEYTPSEVKPFENYQPIKFNHSLLEYEVFHSIERKNLMETDIILEYINKKYLNTLKKVVNKLGKEVSIVSPLKILRAMPFPKDDRIVINYGHKHVLIAVFKNNYIKEIVKNTMDSPGSIEYNYLVEKHSKFTNDSTLHQGIVQKVSELMLDNPTCSVYSIGGNSNFLQEDLQVKNSVTGINFGMRMPLTVENLILGSSFPNYRDTMFNNVTMNMKNRLFGILSQTSQLSNTALAILGDVFIVIMVITLISSYKVNKEYVRFSKELDDVNSIVQQYQGSGGKIVKLEEHLNNLKEGNVKYYYNMAELLRTIESPLEIESLEIENNNIRMVAYADNTALIHQFLNSVQMKQDENRYTFFTLSETDIQTVFRNGVKLDRVEFRGRIQ